MAAILFGVFCHLRHTVSCQDIEEIFAERGAQVDHARLGRQVLPSDRRRWAPQKGFDRSFLAHGRDLHQGSGPIPDTPPAFAEQLMHDVFLGPPSQRGQTRVIQLLGVGQIGHGLHPKGRQKCLGSDKIIRRAAAGFAGAGTNQVAADLFAEDVL
jgi:hypothetical protein